MKILDEYFELQEKIFKHFGYVENWVTIPLDDCTEYYWYLPKDEYEGGTVHFSKNKENLEKLLDNDFDYSDEDKNIDGDDYYTYEIYTQRFLSKWVYETDDATMICVDTQIDGNKYLSIFDNAKRIK